MSVDDEREELTVSAGRERKKRANGMVEAWKRVAASDIAVLLAVAVVPDSAACAGQ